MAQVIYQPADESLEPGDWGRYYARTMVADDGLERLVSPNGMVVIALGSVAEKVIGVHFNPDLHINFKGKRKRGAMIVRPDTVLCTLRCVDETEIILKAGVRGKLMEVNDSRLAKTLLEAKASPLSPDTYIAIVHVDHINELQRISGTAKRRPS